MTKQNRTTRPAAADPPRPAPTPIGDVVPGDPPVPITVWPVPPPRPGDTMTNGLGVRLVHNYSHPTELIVDLTDGPQLARAIIAAGRRSHLQHPASVRSGREQAALVVTGWTEPVANPDEFLGWCATLLRPQGCVAIVLDHDGPIDPAELIAAGRDAGLSYLQHVVAATELSPTRHQPDATRLRVHTDILLLIKPLTQESHR